MDAPLVVSTFPNAKALPLWAALKFGLFAKQDLAVELHETGSSREQRTLLANGQIHIVQAAVDNALAMRAQGQDAIIVMGGEGGMNKFIVQAGLKNLDDIAGGSLLVDSPDTAYALLARKILAQRGFHPGVDYEIISVGNGAKRLARLLKDSTATAAILNPPFSAQAEQHGLYCVGSLDDLFGPYQAGGAFAMRHWCQTNSDMLCQYIRAYLDALEWIRLPANSGIAISLLQEKLNISQDTAAHTHKELLDPKFGFAHQARLSFEGIKNMIQLRQEMESDSDHSYEISTIIDESWYLAVTGTNRTART